MVSLTSIGTYWIAQNRCGRRGGLKYLDDEKRSTQSDGRCVQKVFGSFLKNEGEESEEGEGVPGRPGSDPRRISSRSAPFAYTYANYASGRALPDRLDKSTFICFPL